MNPIEKKQTYWQCSKCGKGHHNREYAEKCCIPKFCTDCGCELKHNWYSAICTDCNEERLFNKAEKLTAEQYWRKFPGNMVVLGDTYYSDVDEAMERWEDNQYPDPINEDERPQYVWGTIQELMHINGDYAIENATEDTYEDAEFSDTAVKEFMEFVKQWNEKYGETYYSENNKVAVLLDWSKFNDY